MKSNFKKGDRKTYIHTVTEEDISIFEGVVVHRVYSTFALGRDTECCTRLFVLEMKDEDEEGIGTFIHIEHLSPGLIGNEVLITGIYEELKGNELTCSFEARVGNRIIAEGKTGQKILKKEKLRALFSSIQ